MKNLIELDNIIYFIFMFASYKFYMDTFLERRIYKRWGIEVGIILPAYIFLSLLPDFGIGGNIIVMSLLAGICGLCLYQGEVKKVFFCSTLWELLGCLCEFIILFLMTISHTEETIFSPAYYSIAQILSECLLVFFTLFVSRIASKKKYKGIKNQTSMILVFMALATVFVDWGVTRIYLYPESKANDYYAILIASIMMTLSVVIIKIYEGLGERADLETRNMVYQSQVEAYRVQISEREETMKEVRRLKHDMKNHLIYIDELIRHKKIEDARSYLDDLLQSSGLSYQGAVNSGNPLVDGLVNYKVPYMKSLHIDFQPEVTIPTELDIPEDNLCIIMGNLLDNAIEGTQKRKEEERQILFELTLKKDNLFLLIQNSCLEEAVVKRGNRFLTTKKDHGHGMGLISVKRAVEECSGDICIDEEKGIFRVSVILPGAGGR